MKRVTCELHVTSGLQEDFATNAVDIAERQSRARAMIYLFFAAAIVLALSVSFGPHGADFLRGLWLGITAGAALTLMPLGRWLKLRNAVVRLMEDEATREHRRRSCAAGFWAAVATGVVLSVVTEGGAAVSPFDTTRLLVTAAVASALVVFAGLELCAGRG